MTKTQLAARVFLNVLGVYTIFLLIKMGNMILQTGSASRRGLAEREVLLFVIRCGPVVIVFAAVCIFLRFLFCWFGKILMEKTGPEIEEEDQVSTVWVVGVFRMVFFLYGMFLFAISIKEFVQLITFIAYSPRLIADWFIYKTIPDVYLLRGYEWINLIKGAAFIMLATYLMAGARYLVIRELSLMEEEQSRVES